MDGMQSPDDVQGHDSLPERASIGVLTHGLFASHSGSLQHVGPALEAPAPAACADPATNPIMHQSVAAAAEARAAEARARTASDTASHQIDSMRFYCCLDQDLLPPLLAPIQRAKMVGVLATIVQLLDNALNKGIGDSGDPKFLHIKLANPVIKKRLDLGNEIVRHAIGPPSLDWLQLSGWRCILQTILIGPVLTAFRSPHRPDKALRISKSI